MIVSKSRIRERTRELLEKADKADEFTTAFQELLESCVEREATKNYQRIIPETGKFFGVPKPILGVIAAEIGRFIKERPRKAPALLKTIWTEGSFEAKQIAGKSLEKFAPENPTICLDFVSSALPDLDNWSVCDNLAMSGVRPIVYSNPQLVLPLSQGWIRDNDKWVKRFGVVSLLGYKRVKTTEQVFELLDLVMEHEDRDVKRGVSWVLREISKQNAADVAEFLVKWAKLNPSKDARWVIKDGMRKLSNDEQERILTLLD